MTIGVESLAIISNNAKEQIHAKAEKLARFWQKKLEAAVIHSGR